MKKRWICLPWVKYIIILEIMTTLMPGTIKFQVINELQDNLIMLYTGVHHNANTILAEQKKQIGQADKTNNLLRMCELAKK